MIHPTAIISPHAKLGDNVTVGPYTIIHDNVLIGPNSIIGSHCEIGVPSALANETLKIGEDALIRSHSVFYAASEIGPHLRTGHHVTVREKTIAGAGWQIGTLSDIQGHCHIGEYVKFHSNVHIGQKSVIGNYVWIFPYTVLTNDPHPPSETLCGVTVEDYAVIATMVTVLPGIKISAGCLIGAHSLVSRDTPADTLVAGSPAKPIKPTKEIFLQQKSGEPAYPWRRHFHRGYPEDAVSKWLAEFGNGKSS